MNTNKRPCQNKQFYQRGFSLLEILIAFSILALSLGVLLRIFAGGLNNAEAAGDYTVAVQIAESLMAKTGNEIPLKAFQDAGDENKKYYWKLTISPYNIISEKFDPKKLPVELFKVNVSVAWGDGIDDNRQIELTTLKLAGKEDVGL